MSFPVGSAVLIRVPEVEGFLPAKIIHENKSGTYRVGLPDGTKYTVPREDIIENKDEPPKTPGRRTKSPGRGKAPGSRGRSPGRVPKAKSPARKKSPGRKPAASLLVTKVEDAAEEAVSPRRSERERKVVTKYEPEEETPTMTLRLKNWKGTPIKTTPRVNSTMEAAIDSDGEDAKLGLSGKAAKVMGNGGDEVDASKVASSRCKTELGGAVGVFFMLVSGTVMAIAAHLILRSTHQAIAGFKPNQTDLITLTAKTNLDFRTLDARKLLLSFPKFDLLGVEIYFGFLLLQLIFSLLPVGRREPSLPGTQGPQFYRCNGIFNALLTLGLVYGLKFYGFALSRVQLNNFLLQWFVCACATGVVLAIACYVKASRLPLSQQNPSLINTGGFYNFLMGKQVNPTFGPIDLKTTLFKIACITMLTLQLVTFLNLDESQRTPTLMLSMGMVNCYILDVLLFEKHFLTTFECTTEGTGLMVTLGYLTFPFYMYITTSYIVVSRFEINIYCGAAIAGLYVLGYMIYRASNAEKSEFRKNPLNPNCANLETIATSRGKKLICSGWWGMVRHPNYFGDIIMQLCFGLVAGFNNPLPWIMPFSTVMLLIHRASRLDARCQAKYGDSWKRYCDKVKRRIIPKVY